MIDEKIREILKEHYEQMTPLDDAIEKLKDLIAQEKKEAVEEEK